ncbi:MAG: glycosyltransferase family 4 protein [Acidobacteria bacterium]|nr:glycosyltransferase family 4 protein [Acidobacteriota bacterium]
MTTVLFLHTTSEIGGSDVSLVRLVEGLDRRRYSMIVALPSDGPLVARLRAAGARVEIMPVLMKLTSRRGVGFLLKFAWNYPRAIAALRQLIRREGVSLVHTNTIHNLYGVTAARLAGVPHVWHFREIVWQSGLLRRLELTMARWWSTRIIVTSNAIAEMYGPPSRWPVQLVRVPNGVETDRFSPGDGQRVRGELGVAPSQSLVGIVCRLDAWKGVDDFLEAVAQVAVGDHEAAFAVIGGPIIGQEPYEDALKTRARELGLGGRVRFTGWRYGPSEMPDVHRALDVLVLASRQPEPFGLVLLEAMSTGKPVVATAHGGPLDIVEDGRTGDLVPPGDSAAMARAIVALLRDPARCARMGTLARARVLAHYTAEQYVTGVEAIYRELVP